MLRYPSKQASTPRYSIPEFNFTLTGLPSTDFRKSDGERFLEVVYFMQSMFLLATKQKTLAASETNTSSFSYLCFTCFGDWFGCWICHGLSFYFLKKFSLVLSSSSRM